MSHSQVSPSHRHTNKILCTVHSALILLPRNTLTHVLLRVTLLHLQQLRAERAIEPSFSLKIKIINYFYHLSLLTLPVN